MYLSSGNSIHKDIAKHNVLETVLGESSYATCSQALRNSQPQTACPRYVRDIVLVFLSPLPRLLNHSNPAILTVTSVVTGAHYGMLVYEAYR